MAQRGADNRANKSRRATPTSSPIRRAYRPIPMGPIHLRLTFLLLWILVLLAVHLAVRAMVWLGEYAFSVASVVVEIFHNVFESYMKSLPVRVTKEMLAPMAKKKTIRNETPITDRESLRKYAIEQDTGLLTGFLTARWETTQDKNALTSLIGVLQKSQDPNVAAFLDLWLAGYQATN